MRVVAAHAEDFLGSEAELASENDREIVILNLLHFVDFHLYFLASRTPARRQCVCS